MDTLSHPDSGYPRIRQKYIVRTKHQVAHEDKEERATTQATGGRGGGRGEGGKGGERNISSGRESSSIDPLLL